MSIIKSYSVGLGDTFYIDHNTDNFTIIDCCLGEENQDDIIGELKRLSSKKGITRFISTHPDEDHIKGLEALDDEIGILNFYAVKNKAIKEEPTASFDRYCELRDHERKAFYISKGCTRRWMNQSDATRDGSGIDILWPDRASKDFQEALKAAEQGESPNNMSAVIRYLVKGGAKVLWMGDLETEFMERIESQLDLSPIDILFAPHHGRESGRVPESLLTKLKPKIIVIGEAPSEDLDYYDGYDTITQNSAGDIVFECEESQVHVFTSLDYEVDFLDDEGQERDDMHYLGTLNLS